MIQPSKYQQILPKSDKLKKLIKLYYVHHSADENATETITYFPNYSTTINVYKNSKISHTKYSRTHEYDASNKYLKLLVSKIDSSREIIMKGSFDKLTIVFYPLGLNHFIDIPLSKLSKDHFSNFDYFGNNFDLLLDKVFDRESIEDKGALLDDFFDSRYTGFDDHRIVQAVDEIFENKGAVSIEKISELLNVSRKTILRLFNKHLCVSPSMFRSIVKFRSALDTYQNGISLQSLSALAYEANYYDQSDLNFHFKDKTGLTPHQLFSAITTIKKGLYWKTDHVPKVQDS